MNPVNAIGRRAIAVASMTGRSSEIAAAGTGMPSPKMIAGRPSTSPMLKMLLPTMLPTAMSRSPRRTAMIEVASSGSEVPIATTVSPTTRLLTPSPVAMLTAPVTSSCEPSTRSPMPTASRRSESHTGVGLPWVGIGAVPAPSAPTRTSRRPMRMLSTACTTSPASSSTPSSSPI